MTSEPEGVAESNERCEPRGIYRRLPETLFFAVNSWGIETSGVAKLAVGKPRWTPACKAP